MLDVALIEGNLGAVVYSEILINTACYYAIPWFRTLSRKVTAWSGWALELRTADDEQFLEHQYNIVEVIRFVLIAYNIIVNYLLIFENLGMSLNS